MAKGPRGEKSIMVWIVQAWIPADTFIRYGFSFSVFFSLVVSWSFSRDFKPSRYVRCFRNLALGWKEEFIYQGWESGMARIM